LVVKPACVNAVEKDFQKRTASSFYRLRVEGCASDVDGPYLKIQAVQVWHNVASISPLKHYASNKLYV